MAMDQEHVQKLVRCPMGAFEDDPVSALDLVEIYQYYNYYYYY